MGVAFIVLIYAGKNAKSGDQKRQLDGAEARGCNLNWG